MCGKSLLRETYKTDDLDHVDDSGHPRSPRRFVKESYPATFHLAAADERFEIAQSPRFELSYIVHRDVNNGHWTVGVAACPVQSTNAGIEFGATKEPLGWCSTTEDETCRSQKGGFYALFPVSYSIPNSYCWT